MQSSRLLRVGIIAVVIVAALYAVAMAYMYVFQRDFVFNPGGELMTPAASGLETVTAETVPMADGTRVTVWHARASPDLSK